MQGSARDALRHRDQCQRRGLIRPQGDPGAALRAARSGWESFGAEGSPYLGRSPGCARGAQC